MVQRYAHRSLEIRFVANLGDRINKIDKIQKKKSCTSCKSCRTLTTNLVSAKRKIPIDATRLPAVTYALEERHEEHFARGETMPCKIDVATLLG